MGDAPEDAARVLLFLQGKLQGNSCVAFDCRDKWIEATAWGLRSMAAREALYGRQPIYMRQRHVGEACRRLRTRGYKIEVGAQGPRMAASSERELLTVIDNFAALIGGLRILEIIFGRMRERNLFHNGFWLFGNTVPGFTQEGRIASPYGWLCSVAIRNISKAGTAAKPSRMIDTLFSISEDYLAIYDAQRYGQFEHSNVDVTEIPRALRESLIWREAFTLPQTPQMVTKTLARAFNKFITVDDKRNLGFDLTKVFHEIDKLLDCTAEDRPTICPKDRATQDFPILFAQGLRKGHAIYNDVIDPVDRSIENQEGNIFYERSLNELVLLPKTLTGAHCCFLVYKLVWSTLPKERASKIVGDSMEWAIQIACEGKSTVAFFQYNYLVKKQKFEIDYAARTDDRIVLFETKAKSLTAPARSGNPIKYLTDFSQSYLAMLRQLSRHEINIKAGHTEIASINDDWSALRLIKLAISPLSYGQMSDKVLLRAIMGSLTRAVFHSVTGRPEDDDAINSFNQNLRKLFILLQQVAPNEEGKIDLGAYLFNVHWLDLGEIIHLLSISRSVSEASRLLMPVTYASRDFWTELAFLERQGMFAVARRPLPENGGSDHDGFA
ncbi:MULTISPECIES: hypothetical protein [unclassified Methylobacterium]|uniref:hypothetical protein n=1 Tax=unclassified Methylobacterium TaxID=2615210 RepID=UPI0011C1F259|nr:MULTISPECIES: hypothetical protein [unclassified Methylobacterium]QEE40859.1 hypothetical protein FVA80_19605 [Methylobacterium sp. WL1]TXN53431.1 hypothetical protein FV241_28165 [Methylobacterium sp. WL2]